MSQLQLPTGTITFLFTDIEGSTRLWQTDPDGMRDALALHNAILTEAIERQEGRVFKTLGDSYCSAFPTAAQALTAAVESQKNLLAAFDAGAMPDEDGAPESPSRSPGGVKASLRVRMAIHTGTADEHDGDYFGVTMSTVARLLSSGYGGQILVSHVTEQLLRDCMPPGTQLRDLGQHQFRDLLRPQHVYQAVHQSLPAEHPRIRSLTSYSHNLPVQLTTFIGRESELGELQDLIFQHHLVTVTGTGGCGKTRLAMQVAANVVDRFSGGVWLIELASITDPCLVAQGVASVLGVRETPGSSIVAAILEDLGERSDDVLLLMDNCEHLSGACAELVYELLRGCGRLRVLATSREPLKVSGEVTWRIPSLAVEDGASVRGSKSEFSESGRLFAERAARVLPKFRLNDKNKAQVSEICRKLDGIPLAIELAAARVKVLSLEQISTRLSDRFQLLTGGDVTAPSRQQTLEATISWSYELLTERERSMLRRLSVFAGGWTLQSAEYVCQGEGVEEIEVLDLLSALVDKSLVIVDEAEESVRYRMLETVRQYARSALEAENPNHPALERHVQFFCELAEEAVPHYSAADQKEWIDRIEAELNNMRAALDVCGTRGALAEGAMRMAGSLARFWHIRGYLTEGRRRIAASMSVPKAIQRGPGWAMVNSGAGILAWEQGDRRSAREFLTVALELWRGTSDEQRVAATLSNLSLVEIDDCAYDAARAMLEESLAIRKRLADKSGVAICLNNLGNIAYYTAEFEAARECYSESLSIRRELGDLKGIATSLNNLGEVARATADLVQAESMFSLSMKDFEDLGDGGGSAVAHFNLANIALSRGDFDEVCRQCELGNGISTRLDGTWYLAAFPYLEGEAAFRGGEFLRARSLMCTALERSLEVAALQFAANCTEVLALMELEDANFAETVKLLGVSDRMRVGYPRSAKSMLQDRRAVADKALAAMFTQDEYKATYALGNCLDFRQCVEFAIGRCKLTIEKSTDKLGHG